MSGILSRRAGSVHYRGEVIKHGDETGASVTAHERQPALIEPKDAHAVDMS